MLASRAVLPHEAAFPNVWHLVKHLLCRNASTNFWLKAASGTEDKAPASAEACQEQGKGWSLSLGVPGGAGAGRCSPRAQAVSWM